MTEDSLGTPIGLGHTAEVFAWREGTILKLFYEWFPLSAIEHETRVSHIIYEAGLPVPAATDLIKIGCRHGLIYERILGRSLLEVVANKPWLLVKYIQMFAELQYRIHQTAGIKGLPSQHQKLKQKILSANQLSPLLKTAALETLASLPEGDRLCHGDFHPDNILLAEQGPVIIDWIDATCGNPAGGVARTSLLIDKAPVPDGTSRKLAINLFRKVSHRLYLRRYFQLNPRGLEAFESWKVVNAAARLSERVPEEQELLAYVTAHLKQREKK